MPFPATLPTPRTPDPREAPPLRWGVLGTGWIARQFCAALREHTRQQVHAVGSRSQSSAAAFAQDVGAPAAYGSYEELVRDDDVDVVYAATPHHLHLPNALLALAAGKHVLVEKPLGLSAGEAEQVAHAARAGGLLAMEALWTMFLPKFDVVRQLLDDGALGRLRTVQADHGQWFAADNRILRRDLSGGSMHDLATYPLAFATWVLGAPARVHAIGSAAPSGVNGQTGMLLGYDGGATALLHSSVLTATPTTGMIAGDAGYLAFDEAFYQPGGFAAHTRDGRRLRYDELAVGHEALCYQAAELARCLDQGLTGSPLWPLEQTIAYLRVMDEARRQTGDVLDAERD